MNSQSLIPDMVDWEDASVTSAGVLLTGVGARAASAVASVTLMVCCTQLCRMCAIMVVERISISITKSDVY